MDGAQKKIFFDHLRQTVFRGSLSQAQVEGIEFLIKAWFSSPVFSKHPLEYLAYCLATAYHETAATMRPIEEYGKGRGRKYGRRDKQTGHVYYGRGYVQLTWRYNYQKATDELKVDFVNRPETALDPVWASHILFLGCLRGWFTGKKLSNYWNASKKSFNAVGARRIVNGTDRAKLIAGYYEAFMEALEAARTEPIRRTVEPDLDPDMIKPVQAGTTGKPLWKSKNANIGGMLALGGGSLTVFQAARQQVEEVASLFSITPLQALGIFAVFVGGWYIYDRFRKSHIKGV